MKKIIAATLIASVSTLFAADGAAIYGSRCASCHGKDGHTKALGKSAPIAGMKDVEKTLAAYKAGTLNKYGMGGLMKGQAASLSGADAKAVSAYIAGLK